MRSEGLKPKKKKSTKPKKQTGKGLLTLKEQKIKKALIEGKSKTEACRIGGYAATTAETRSGEIVDRIVGKCGGIQALMDEIGLSDKRLLETLKEGLEANKVISAIVIAEKPDGEPGERMADASGVTKDFVEVPDHLARHKFMDSGLKLRGHLKDKLDVAHTVETYEERRKRLGLDKR